MAAWCQGTFQVSCLRACRLAQCGRASWYRRSRATDQSALRIRIRDLANARPRLGYLRILVLLRRERWRVNRNECDGSIDWRDYSYACAPGIESMSRCIVAQPQSRPVLLNVEAWILCMIPWPMDGRIGPGRSSIPRVAKLLCWRPVFGCRMRQSSVRSSIEP